MAEESYEPRGDIARGEVRDANGECRECGAQPEEGHRWECEAWDIRPAFYRIFGPPYKDVG